MKAPLRVGFQGRGNVETFSWACVQPMGDGIQRTLSITGQVRPFGQVLAQQAIGVFVGATLPGAVRLGKEDLDREPLSQLLMLGHLFAPIIRQGFPQCGRHVPEFLRQALAGTRRIRPLHPGQDDPAGRPLHQGPDSRSIVRSLDEVAFPVTRHGASAHVGGTLGDGRHVGNLAAAVCASCPRPAGLARLTQRRQQLAPQRSAWQHIQAYIDGLGREVFPHGVRIRASEPPGNLLGLELKVGKLNGKPRILPLFRRLTSTMLWITCSLLCRSIPIPPLRLQNPMLPVSCVTESWSERGAPQILLQA